MAGIDQMSALYHCKCAMKYDTLEVYHFILHSTTAR